MRSGPEPAAAEQLRPRPDTGSGRSLFISGLGVGQICSEEGRMRPSPYYDRVVDVMEELMKFTLLTRDASPYLTDRYSERKESAAKLENRRTLQSA